ncbi:MAG: Tetratricopeptide 2 repeat protein [Planctomycetaceae bacterium]|nr:Tetratricopeptide 2 repeat protein [Planctomycetaceae bacterium]
MTMNLRRFRWLTLGLIGWLSLTSSSVAQLKKLFPRRDPKPADAKPVDPNPAEGTPAEPADAGPISPLEAKVRQAQEAYEEERFEDCIKLTTEVLNENPRHAVARYHRASALIDLGRLTRDGKQIRTGVADAREALSVAGNQHLIFHVPYFYGLTSLAEIENRKSHAELAVSIAGTLLQREDLERDVRGLVLFQRGFAKMYLQDFRGAAADYTAALEIDPKFEAAHFGRADAYSKGGETGKAAQCYDLAASAMPENPLVFNNRGTFNLQQGRIGAAITDFSKALQLDPDFAMAALNRGYANSQKQAWAEAEADYSYSLEAVPEQPLALRLLGTARLAQGKTTLALDAYSKAVTLEPNNPENYSSRGFARFFAQDYARAATDFSKTLQLSPETTMVVPWKYAAQVRSDQAAAAKRELQAFVASRPKTPNWHVTLSQYLLGEIDDAALLAVTKSSSDINAQKQWLCEARYFQGLQSLAAGKSQQAKSLFEDCVKTQQTQLTAYRGAKLALSQ